jgi:hypothetical protein
VPRSDTRRIVIIVFRSRGWNANSGRTVLGRRASGQRRAQRGEYIPAKQPGLPLLVSGEPAHIDWRSRVAGEWNRAGHYSTVVSRIEAEPRAVFSNLILQVGGFIEPFIVIDAENASRCGWGFPGTADLRKEKRADTVEKTMSAEKPWRSGTLTRPANPGILDLSQANRAQLSELVQRVRNGRLRTNIGNVAALDDAVAAFNRTERIKGKTIIRVVRKDSGIA